MTVQEPKADRESVRQRRVERLERQWWGRRVITLFVCWHLFAIAIWLLPFSPGIVQSCAPLVRVYMTTTGFMQSWTMFSPNPDNLDVYMQARITYAQGDSRVYTFPRMATMSYAKRYEEERWRKFIENATHGSNTSLWPSLARYAARVNNYDEQNPPVAVELFRRYRMIPDPGQPIPSFQTEPMIQNGRSYVLNIHAEDLK